MYGCKIESAKFLLGGQARAGLQVKTCNLRQPSLAFLVLSLFFLRKMLGPINCLPDKATRPFFLQETDEVAMQSRRGQRKLEFARESLEESRDARLLQSSKAAGV